MAERRVMLRRQALPVGIAKILLRARDLASDMMMKKQTLKGSSLKTALNQLYYMAWKLLYGDVFPINLNGQRILFHDPGSPENYVTSFTGFLYEHSVIIHLKDIIKQHDSPTFLDIGAHYGYYTLCMSKLGGPLSRVFSFEPNSEYFRVLSTNVRLNKLRNVVLYRVALSDMKKRVTLETSQAYKSLGFIQERRKMRSLKPMNSLLDGGLTAIPFDEIALKTGIRPDIVKVDVHGAEGNVIAGMKHALVKDVGHLYCEMHREMCDGYNARDVITTLQDAGMEVFEFHGFRGRNGRLINLNTAMFSTTWTKGTKMIYARK